MMQSCIAAGLGYIPPESFFFPSLLVAATSVGFPLPLSSTVRLGNSTITQKLGGAFDRVTTGCPLP